MEVDTQLRYPGVVDFDEPLPVVGKADIAEVPDPQPDEDSKVRGEGHQRNPARQSLAPAAGYPGDDANQKDLGDDTSQIMRTTPRFHCCNCSERDTGGIPAETARLRLAQGEMEGTIDKSYRPENEIESVAATSPGHCDEGPDEEPFVQPVETPAHEPEAMQCRPYGRRNESSGQFRTAQDKDIRSGIPAIAAREAAI